LQSFSGCRSGWSKEPQWTNDCFLLVITNELGESEKSKVEFQGCRKISDEYRGISSIFTPM
jgi:hypothetical protein